MSTDTSADNTPPVNVEQWLDFIIASAAHRSHDPNHQKFGERLIERYFISLPERYKDDLVASQYFDNMLCAVASAIRGFSVARDLFQTNWDSLKSQRENSQKQVERLDAFAPLNKGGIWGVAVAVVIGIGLGAPISQSLQVWWYNSTLITLLLIAGFIGISIVLLQVLIEWMRERRLSSIENQFPLETLEYWQDKSLKSYRTILKQFLPIAIEITGRFYPNSALEDIGEERLNEMVERHFAFKMKTKVKVKEASD